MRYKLFALNSCEDNITEFQKYAEQFDAEFSFFESPEELENALYKTSLPVVILLDIDKYSEKKYRLSVKYNQRRNTSVFFITKTLDPDDRVRWLSYGAAGYLKKPFRVEEVLRRAYAIMTMHQDVFISDNNFYIDLKDRAITYKGKTIKATPKLFDLIVYFVTNEGKVISRDEIMREVFGIKDYLTDRNIDTMVKQIRKMTSYDVIKTVRGQGYIYKKRQ